MVVDDVTLEVASGELISLLGPSGCGKTTLLRMVAGLIAPTSGRILIDGADITALPPHKRQLGLVFQSYALFPHLTVAANVGFGLRRQGMRGAELERRVTAALELVRLGHLASRMSWQLSGGQQQRVAFARAVAPRPRILLLDEPLSNLDAQLRGEMQIEIKRLQRELGITSLFVTHDQTEALSLSDRVCVMSQGRIQQVGTPEHVYRAPANGFVAGFIGTSNRLLGRVEAAGRPAGTVLVLGDGTRLQSSMEAGPDGGAVDIIIRHDAVRLTALPADSPAALDGTVIMRSFSGAQVQLVVRLDTGTDLVSDCATVLPVAGLPVGARVRVTLDPASVFVAGSV